MHWLDSIIRGEPTEEAIEHLARGVRSWWISPSRALTDAEGRRIRRQRIGLARHLGLPESADAMRLQMRDHYLREAGAALGIDRPWQRARALHTAAQAFMRHRWFAWVDFAEPPPYASTVEAALWRAAQAGGGRLPSTVRRIDQVLRAEALS